MSPEINHAARFAHLEELRKLSNLPAFLAAAAFHVTDVMVLKGDGGPIRSDCDLEGAFTPPRYKFLPPPPPDDWPLIELSAPGVVTTTRGKRPKGHELIRPQRMLQHLLYRPAHVRAGVVLEIEPSAIDIMRREFRLRPLPPRVPWTRNRAGDWQGWFMWPLGMCRDGENALPAGVRLLDRVAEAPIDATDVPERLSAFKLPTLPKWIALAAGGRDAAMTEECLLHAHIGLAPLETITEGFSK